ncbi:MAG: hypothetical protein AAGG59_09360 [Bacteroidota bacterium]
MRIVKITFSIIFILFLVRINYAQEDRNLKEILEAVITNDKISLKLEQVSKIENDTVYFLSTLAIQKNIEDYLNIYTLMSTNKRQQYLFHKTDRYYIVLFSNLFASSLDPGPISHFLITKKIRLKGETCKLSFFATSFSENNTLSYFKCSVVLNKNIGKWDVLKVVTKDISFKKTPFT